jgi:hypothetical protein
MSKEKNIAVECTRKPTMCPCRDEDKSSEERLALGTHFPLPTRGNKVLGNLAPLPTRGNEVLVNLLQTGGHEVLFEVVSLPTRGNKALGNLASLPTRGSKVLVEVVSLPTWRNKVLVNFALLNVSNLSRGFEHTVRSILCMK